MYTQLGSLLGSLLHKDSSLSEPEVTEARSYVEADWTKHRVKRLKDSKTILGLPNQYLSSTSTLSKAEASPELFYWDSYFMAQALLKPPHQQLVCGILDDLFVLLGRFGYIPQGSTIYPSAHSQPPLLTSFIFDLYDAYHLDDGWLDHAIKKAYSEYAAVWLGTTGLHKRLVHHGLSRYYDVNELHQLAAEESGWVASPRFHDRCLDYLPIDLNALLYKYEVDFAKAARILQHDAAATEWDRRAEQRKASVNELMWHKARGFYFDYDYVHHRRSTVVTLAAYMPLWAGMASSLQAAALVRALPALEYSGGLAMTDRLAVSQSQPSLRSYPNASAPHQLLVIRGLDRYGYHVEARRLAYKWLRGNLAWFKRNGEFLEAYNVVRPSQMLDFGVASVQSGYGWTNGVFERLCQDYIDRGL